MATPHARALALACLLAAGTGCLPAIAHGPRVEPGASVGVTAAYASGPKVPSDIFSTPFLLGTVGLNIGHGWVPERADAPAARVGFHVPVPVLLAMQGDAYVQAPARWLGPLDGGVGLNTFLVMPTRVLTPYVQLGRVGARGSGWYTTQGLLIIRDPGGGYPHDVSHLAWMPAVAYQATSGRTTTHLFATGVFGRERERCDRFSGYCEPGAARWVVAAGMTLEYRPRR